MGRWKKPIMSLQDDTSDSVSIGSPITATHTSNDSETSDRLSPPVVSSSTATKCPSPTLPPCRVCGERASGFHYGLNTCEACKGFFRRSLQRKEEYSCNEDGKCIIEPGKRNLCPCCRYKKCVALGMSKTAIKTGRYTHAKRTRDIQEVKRIERQRKVDGDSDLEFNKDKVINALMKAQEENPIYPHELIDKLEEVQNQYLQEYEYSKKVFGLEGCISMSEYKEFFQKTGIDIDGRRQMLSKCIPQIEMVTHRYINFAKAIPGFKELLIEDQIKLIKAARFEVFILSAYKGYHPKHDIVTGATGLTHHLDELCRIYDREFLLSCFRMARRLRKFNLTKAEIYLMQAIVIFFTDRIPLNKPYAVENIQNQLADILHQQVAQTHPENRLMFAHLLNYMSDLRILSQLYDNQIEKIKVIVTEIDIEVPPLVLELCA